jgi:DNA (cytosine-5)-methyltransferase 1
MLKQFLPFRHELVVVNFAGGGGACSGIVKAIGRPIDIAINHDQEAVAMHRANHPQTKHYCEDVFKAVPRKVTRNQPVGLAWFSPDCKHFSKAKGGRPVNKKIRGLAWVAVRWAKEVKPRVIILENVEEFADWGPLLENGQPCPDRKGFTFNRWAAQMRNCGYTMEMRELSAKEYGAPTIRKRLFIILRRDDQPIVWPKPTHAKPTDPAVKRKRLKPYRTAAECIDWDIPCPSIFLSPEEAKEYGCKRPLAEATMRRIAAGVKRFVMDSADPFIVPITHTGDPGRVHSINEPLRTVTTAQRGEFAVVTPFVTKFRTGSTGHRMDEPMHTITAGGDMKRPAGAAHAMGIVVPTLINTRNGERIGQAPRVRDLFDPYATVTAHGSQGALVAAFLEQANTGMVGHDPRKPLSTIVGKGCTQRLIASHLVKLKGTCKHGQDVRDPLHTVQAGGTHYAQVQAFLMQYYGEGGSQVRSLKDPMPTVVSKDRVAIVTINSVDYVIVDIGMRMLTPRELYRAQGFSNDYIIDHGIDARGRRVPLTKTAQVRMCGNAVCPPVAEALVRANFEHEQRYEAVA